jgi:hypothetical protein
VNCGPRSNFLYIAIPFTFTRTVYFYLHTITLLPLDMLNPLFIANRWDWQPHRKLGAKYLVVLCACSMLLLGEEAPTSTTHQQFFSSYLPLGMPNGLLLTRHQRCGTFIGENADWFRVFMSEGLYRRKGDVRGRTRGPHHLVARPDGGRHPMVCLPPSPPPSPLWTPSRTGENRNFGLCFVHFWEYFLCNFSKTQK